MPEAAIFSGLTISGSFAGREKKVDAPPISNFLSITDKVCAISHSDISQCLPHIKRINRGTQTISTNGRLVSYVLLRFERFEFKLASTNMTTNRSKNSSLKTIPVAHSPRSHRSWLCSPNIAKYTWRKHGRWLRGLWRSRVSLALWIWSRVAWRSRLQERHSTLRQFSMLVI